MLKNLRGLQKRLFALRPLTPTARTSTQRYRPAIDTLEDRCCPSLTVLAPGYSVTTFAPPPNLGVQATGPDSIAVDQSGEHVFVGYNNGTVKDGSDPKARSTIVEFSDSGTVLHYWQTPGHNDGLKIDPETGNVWALQNEDGKPNLTVINPHTTAMTAYTFAPPDNGGTGTPGGYDDIAFLHGKVYLTESNPDPSSTTGSAVVQVKLPSDPAVNNRVIIVRTVLPLVTTATDPTGKTVSLTLTDPDSMTAKGNNLVFTSQADDLVLTIHNPGQHQTVTVVNVHDATNASLEVDDTIFTPNSHGAILVVDSAGTVYEITGSAVKKGLVLSSGDASDALGTFDPKTGLFTPVITGFAGQPKGLAFLPTEGSDDGFDGGSDDGQGHYHQGG